MKLRKLLTLALVLLILTSVMVSAVPSYADYTSDLKAFWDFTNGSAVDLTSNRNNGTKYGTPTITTSQKGDALTFKGSDYIQVPNSSSLNFGTGDFSFSLLFKTNSTKGNNTIIDKRTSTGQGYHFTLTQGRPLLQINDGVHTFNYWPVGSTTAYNDGNWHILEVTVDRDSATGINMYIDLVLVYTGNPTAISGSLSNNEPLYIGKHTTYAGNNFEGSLDNICFFNTCTQGWFTYPSFNTYYGHLHNHSNISDNPAGTPTQAYAYARDTAKLDFFGLADHSQMIDSAEWTALKNTANSYNNNGSYVTFYGFEWSSNSNYGHVAVINSDDYCSHTNAATDTFAELSSWLSTRNAVAFFNHPGREDDIHKEFDHFSTAPNSKFVGMEFWNKTDGFDEYFYNDGYYTNDGNRNYFDEAIARGWKIGASGSDDHHSTSWGMDTDARMAVLAKEKTRESIFEALKAKRFYSTLDKNLKLNFVVNGNPMGTTMTGGYYSCTISAGDPDFETFTEYTMVKNGVPVYTIPVNAYFINAPSKFTASAGDYAYVIVRQADGDEAISSPIFFT